MGNNYTVTMPDDLLSNAAALTWKQLHEIKYSFDEPFQIELADGELFSSERVVRLIPGRRLVAFGSWQGKDVVAKLFFDSRHANRHMEKDSAGVKTLLDNKVPSPHLLFKGATKDNRIHVLIYERIFDAQSLDVVWQNKNSSEDVMPELQSVIIEIATQHVLGVLQHDLHLKNFLLTDKTIYTLDGAQIQLFPSLLPKKQSMKSLALFLSQLGIGVEKYQEMLFRHYAKARGWLLKREDIIELFLQIKRWNQHRWVRFEKKIFRECTDFTSIKHWQTFGMCDRKYLAEEFQQFLQNPESAFTHPSVTMLKDGRSATVVKVTLDKREYVVKRYNLKNIWHRLRRCVRPTRAMSSWRLAQKMNLFGVQTAEPVAFIENRFLGLRGTSYFVSGYISGGDAGKYFERCTADDHQMMTMVKSIAKLLRNLARLEITHGDLKITNILINQHEQPVLIDLDGASEHVSISGLRNSWKREIKRFMQNFSKQPQVAAKFKAEFGRK